MRALALIADLLPGLALTAAGVALLVGGITGALWS